MNKYNIGQEVWLFRESQPSKICIRKIWLDETYTPYTVTYEGNRGCTRYDESELFATKEELKAHMIKLIDEAE